MSDITKARDAYASKNKKKIGSYAKRLRKLKPQPEQTFLIKKTSPPSAQEAAMSAMQYETFLKHLESFLKLP